MKRITTLVLAVAFALGGVAAAQADGIDIKVKGQWDFAFGWVENKVFKKSYNDTPGRPGNGGGRYRRDNDNFEARQRIRTQVNFITSEYLQAVLMFEIGDLDWGRNPDGRTYGRSSGGGLDADGVNIEVKRAYLDWIIPHTEVSVRMGIQGITLPSGRMGNPVFDADVAAITVSSPITDWLAATVFWARPFNQYNNDYDEIGIRDLSDKTDVFGIVLPFTYFEGFQFSPYFVYSWVGVNSGAMDYMFDGRYSNTISERHRAKMWWAGVNLNVDILDPFVFNIDAIYGNMSRAEVGGLGQTIIDGIAQNDGLAYGTDVKASGWYVAAALDYKTDWGTPGIFGWWASGDRKNAWKDGRIGRIPVLGTDGGFGPTSFGTEGFYGIGNGYNQGAVTSTGTGTWGVGIQVADVSFIEDLSHVLRVAYYRGTNKSQNVEDLGGSTTGLYPYAADALYLTTKDQVIEVNFDHTYRIYENLEACLELGYLHLRSNQDTWRQYDTNYKKNDNAWKAEINFRYSF